MAEKQTVKEKLKEVNKKDKLQSFLKKISKEELYSSLSNTYSQISSINDDILEVLHYLYPITKEGYEIMVLKVHKDSDAIWKFMMSKVDKSNNPVGEPLIAVTYEVDDNLPALCNINSILMSQLKHRLASISNDEKNIIPELNTKK